MIRVFYIIFIIIILSGCSLKKDTKFWSTSKKINQEKLIKQKENEIALVFNEEQVLKKEFNENLEIEIDKSDNKISTTYNHSNNYGSFNFDGDLKNVSKYKFSKIKNFYQYEPVISFIEKNLIFFENKGSILKFNENSELIWKKNYYSKSEKKLNPILHIANNENNLIVADNVAKIYMLDVRNGNLVWSKNNLAPIIFKIKFYKINFLLLIFLIHYDAFL